MSHDMTSNILDFLQALCFIVWLNYHSYKIKDIYNRLAQLERKIKTKK